MSTSILFVCMGNICRSPAAEGVARKILPKAKFEKIDSAGISPWSAGKPPDANMRSVAKENGFDIDDLRARPAFAVFCGTEFIGFIANGAPGTPGEGIPGTSCDVEEDGSDFVMTCGGVPKARWPKPESSSSQNNVSSSSSLNASSSSEEQIVECDDIDEDQFCDTRDGTAYKFAEFDEQIWMAENLNYAATGSMCFDEEAEMLVTSTEKCGKYGRFYNWATAMALASTCNNSDCSSIAQVLHKGVCPSGWHLPSKEEWEALIEEVGGEEVAGLKLKAESGWKNDGNGDGTTDFAALPGGTFDASGEFTDGELGEFGNWWSTKQDNNTEAYFFYAKYNEDSMLNDFDKKSYHLNVRCVKN